VFNVAGALFLVDQGQLVSLYQFRFRWWKRRDLSW
jgi:hypothetical protein